MTINPNNNRLIQQQLSLSTFSTFKSTKRNPVQSLLLDDIIHLIHPGIQINVHPASRPVMRSAASHAAQLWLPSGSSVFFK